MLKIELLVLSFSDEESVPFTDDLPSSEEEGGPRYEVVQGGTNKSQRCLIDSRGFKFTEEQSTKTRLIEDL